jgi:hypothetical protein
MSVAVEQLSHPAVRAVGGVRQQLSDVADVPLWSMRDAEVEQLLSEAHRAAAQLSDLVLRITAEADRRNLAGQAGAPNTRAWLRHALQISPAAAKRQQLLASRLDTDCPTTREALAAGRIDTDQAQVITRTVADFPAGLDPQLVESAEQRLLAEADQYDAMLLARLAERILELIDPDGAESRLGDTLARQEAAWRRREFGIGYALDGMVTLRGWLPAESAELLRAALDPLSRPRPADATGPDHRQPGQRRADALVELATRQLNGGQLPETGGEKPHLVVTVDYFDLRDQIGAGHLDTGLALSPHTVRRVACDAKIIPAVLASTGEPLDLGRSVRLISGALRRAVVLRDRGCAFPGCDRPPAWCDGHHIVHWVDGGPTSLDNSVLLCGHHHRLVHRGEWHVTLDRDRHPQFTPPPWIDPERKPLRNTMHRRC